MDHRSTASPWCVIILSKIFEHTYRVIIACAKNTFFFGTRQSLTRRARLISSARKFYVWLFAYYLISHPEQALMKRKKKKPQQFFNEYLSLKYNINIKDHLKIVAFTSKSKITNRYHNSSWKDRLPSYLYWLIDRCIHGISLQIGSDG